MISRDTEAQQRPKLKDSKSTKPAKGESKWNAATFAREGTPNNKFVKQVDKCGSKLAS